MNGFIIIITALFLLAFWRGHHQRYASLRFRYKMYALRDKLRLLAAQEKIDPNSWVFDYYDNSISKTIKEHYYITIATFVCLIVVHRNDEKLKLLLNNLQSEQSKNLYLKDIQKEYNQAIGEYLAEQHLVSGKLIIVPIGDSIFGTFQMARKLRDWLNTSIVFPEISASKNYC